MCVLLLASHATRDRASPACGSSQSPPRTSPLREGIAQRGGVVEDRVVTNAPLGFAPRQVFGVGQGLALPCVVGGGPVVLCAKLLLGLRVVVVGPQPLERRGLRRGPVHRVAVFVDGAPAPVPELVRI